MHLPTSQGARLAPFTELLWGPVVKGAATSTQWQQTPCAQLRSPEDAVRVSQRSPGLGPGSAPRGQRPRTLPGGRLGRWGGVARAVAR